MKNVNMENLVNVVKENNNNKQLIEKVAKGFLKRGINKSLAKRMFVDSSRLVELSQIELIYFTDLLYRATKDSSIKIEKIFTQEDIEMYYKAINKNSNYTPKGQELDERDKLKLEFLNEKYGNYNTKQHYFYLYLAHIKDEETYLGYDLHDFSVYEIMYIMQSIVGSISTKNNTLSFITKYLDYCVESGIIETNVLDTIDSSSLIDKNSEQLESSYVTLDELERELAWLEMDEQNNIHSLDVMIVLLLRNGITTKEMISLKNSDFDFNTNVVTIHSENGTKRIKLDEKTMGWVKESRDSSGVVNNTRHVLKTIDDYIIKTTSDTYDKEQAIFNIRRRLAKFKNVGFRPLNENILITCKKIDIVDALARKNGKVEIKDFKKVQKYFGNSENSYYKLKVEYELLRG